MTSTEKVKKRSSAWNWGFSYALPTIWWLEPRPFSRMTQQNRAFASNYSLVRPFPHVCTWYRGPWCSSEAVGVPKASRIDAGTKLLRKWLVWVGTIKEVYTRLLAKATEDNYRRVMTLTRSNLKSYSVDINRKLNRSVTWVKFNEWCPGWLTLLSDVRKVYSKSG